MVDKFNIDELLIRVMPAGFLLAIAFLFYGDRITIELETSLDFLYTFLFFSTAFILGELLQTLAHLFEWAIDLFFRLRRPSQVFLYKNNPVLRNEQRRSDIFAKLKVSSAERQIFDTDYSRLAIAWWNHEKVHDHLSQRLFWQLYTQVSDSSEMKVSNRNYLFVRVNMVEFLLMTGIFFTDGQIIWGLASGLVALVFLWRARGVARGLVFKCVLLNLREPS